jgi:L-alanine-DL-glutamate epimerase-like enolase superfamily enzyme
MANNGFVIQAADLFVGTAPLVSPFRIATGQHNELDNLFLRIKTTTGVVGFGEAAVATHITGETIEKTRTNLQAVADQLVGTEITDPVKLIADYYPFFVNNHAALAAFEMALLDLFSRTRGIPFWQLFTPPSGYNPTPVFSTDITIVIGSLEEAVESARHFVDRGFKAFKIKVGKEPDLDLQRVLAVHRIAPDSTLILDANMGFDADGMLLFLRRLAGHGVYPALLEQPVPKGDWDGLAAVSKEAAKNGILVCADESVGSLADAQYAISRQAVSAINIKFMKTGIVESEQIARLACQHGIKLMLGAMMESSLAITASAHFAAGMGCFDFHDLDTTFFIKGGFSVTPYLDDSGCFSLVSCAPGIGVEPPLP